ncbi:flavin monoamine oxidase family protein [Seonamhaeicola marinus]|uniref:Tryptophan 2-monooxygenase n=1 Tax=Seonamhaeicola marinus TaxID=1912246 RepID=A0A5D0HFD3_9FLAO|nr:FAD-dependent oxidoreductase [Seonamhaeicola marinus]TYA70001.1 FAD-dependent oxidoreductase [Seonamhaeicola marinus]
MTRKEFVKICGILGIGLPLQSTFAACSETSDSSEASNINKVIIVGAGPAGLTSAYLLNQQGIEVQVLEANSYYGGRTKRNTNFANFPIPLGAEWLHVERGVFDEIVNDANIQVETKTTPYNQSTDFGLFEGMQIRPQDIGFTIDQKFISSSWLDFFEEYIVPSIESKIAYNKVVQSVNYSANQVEVKTVTEIYTADKVIVTVPVKMLQNGAITFTPELPNDKVNAINNVTVWDGCKAFIEFKEKFYPTFIGYDIMPESAGQKLYYDASYGQNTTQHILGLFAVGTGTLPYVNLLDTDLIDFILNELDAIFNGKASANYVKHTFQNWNKEPYANGAYINDEENWKLIRTLGTSVNGKLFFAGDAYTNGEDWSSVHAAARSAKRAVREMTR